MTFGRKMAELGQIFCRDYLNLIKLGEKFVAFWCGPMERRPAKVVCPLDSPWPIYLEAMYDIIMSAHLHMFWDHQRSCGLMWPTFSRKIFL